MTQITCDAVLAVVGVPDALGYVCTQEAIERLAAESPDRYWVRGQYLFCRLTGDIDADTAVAMDGLISLQTGVDDVLPET